MASKNEINTEKVTVNVGFVDLGQIDLLVQEGFYSNRTDLIRTAIRNQLNSHSEMVKQAATQKQLVWGMQFYSKNDLEKIKDEGIKLHIQVLGFVGFSADITPELAHSTIETIWVLGAFHASKEIKQALKNKIV